MPGNRTIEKFLMKAKESSFNATYPRQKLGSCLVYGNKIIALGCNTNKTSPVQVKFNKYRNYTDFYAKNNGVVHAEISILLKTKFLDLDWSKTTLYIYRQFKDGHRALSRPCNACAQACWERGIGTIIYSTEDGFKTWKWSVDGYVEE